MSLSVSCFLVSVVVVFRFYCCWFVLFFCLLSPNQIETILSSCSVVATLSESSENLAPSSGGCLEAPCLFDLSVCLLICLDGLAAVAEVGYPPGAPGVPVLLGLGDGSGRLGLVPHAGHQPL